LANIKLDNGGCECEILRNWSWAL